MSGRGTARYAGAPAPIAISSGDIVPKRVARGTLKMRGTDRCRFLQKNFGEVRLFKKSSRDAESGKREREGRVKKKGHFGEPLDENQRKRKRLLNAQGPRRASASRKQSIIKGGELAGRQERVTPRDESASIDGEWRVSEERKEKIRAGTSIIAPPAALHHLDRNPSGLEQEETKINALCPQRGGSTDRPGNSSGCRNQRATNGTEVLSVGGRPAACRSSSGRSRKRRKKPKKRRFLWRTAA